MGEVQQQGEVLSQGTLDKMKVAAVDNSIGIHSKQHSCTTVIPHRFPLVTRDLEVYNRPWLLIIMMRRRRGTLLMFHRATERKTKFTKPVLRVRYHLNEDAILEHRRYRRTYVSLVHCFSETALGYLFFAFCSFLFLVAFLFRGFGFILYIYFKIVLKDKIVNKIV